MRIIAGEARGRRIDAPEGLNTRPTLDRVRENLFNMLQGSVRESTVLDLFAGSGALSLEALSRGAASAVLVDRNRAAITCQKKNVETLRYSGRTRIIFSDWKAAVGMLREEKAFFDLVFLDPPYASDELRDVFTALLPLISQETLIVLEHEAGKAQDVPPAFRPVKERSWGYCAVSMYQLAE